MCGIFFSVSTRGPLAPNEDTTASLASRGPDSAQRIDVEVIVDDGFPDPQTHYLTFFSTVLALRGQHVTSQPLIDAATGSILCWNGEAWKIRDKQIEGNDTLEIFSRLLDASLLNADNADHAIAQVLTSIAGPFAMIFYDAVHRLVYFGRDILGRRSLMHMHPTDHELVICSINSLLCPDLAAEVDTSVFFRIDLRNQKAQVEAMGWKRPIQSITRVVPVKWSAPALPSDAAVNNLIDELRRSLSLRVTDIPTLRHNDHKQPSARVAFLFSGGLDCTLLARIAHTIIPLAEPIDLLNVAFENPRTKHDGSTLAYEACPDRMTGRSSCSELLSTCPGRLWRFISINIPMTEFQSARPKIISLMAPHDTEMDLSISIALYFAARGKGTVLPRSPDLSSGIDTQLHPAEPSEYTTTARVLLSGLGADELFGGYTRHATAYRRGGHEALIEELDLDWSRIGKRNLGRDDRVLSHWGREVRYPYLDENFTKWALELPVWEKCGFHFKVKPREYGTSYKTIVETEEDLDPAKLILRMAAWRLNMKRAAAEKKRAIQFGARTAKMGGSKIKGTDKVF